MLEALSIINWCASWSNDKHANAYRPVHHQLMIDCFSVQLLLACGYTVLCLCNMLCTTSLLPRMLRFDQLRTIDGYLLTAQELALGWVLVSCLTCTC